MRKAVLSTVAAIALATPAMAADMKIKAVSPPPPPPSPWDVAFGAGLTSDYIFRGITQSNHNPSVSAYFEPRYNVSPYLQLYVGVAGESISFPNRAAAEIDGLLWHSADLRSARPRLRRLVLLVSGRDLLQRQPRTSASVSPRASSRSICATTTPTTARVIATPSPAITPRALQVTSPQSIPAGSAQTGAARPLSPPGSST